jgi:colicin import membrane protein
VCMMPKLKTFTTEQGFFELAVAAPSRAAALRAWGMKHDLFAQGLARQTGDRATVAVTMAKPGMVLRRPLGAKTAFGTDAELPKVPAGKAKKRQSLRQNAKAEREKAAKALAELDQSYRRRLAALHEELHGVQNQIREVSREWKDRRKLLPDARRLKPRR